MKNNEIDDLYDVIQFSPETAVFDAYIEEQKSRSSTPNTIIRRSPIDIKTELLHTMEVLEDIRQEIQSVRELQNFELRKNLLKIIAQEEANNKNSIMQIIKTLLCEFSQEHLKKKLLSIVNSSKQKHFLLVFNELGSDNPVGLYALIGFSAKKLYGLDSLPETLSDDLIRFTLKVESNYKKFKVLKTKSINNSVDAVILR